MRYMVYMLYYMKNPTNKKKTREENYIKCINRSGCKPRIERKSDVKIHFSSKCLNIYSSLKVYDKLKVETYHP